MILTVTPNAALDISYEVDTLRPGEVHRVGEVRSRAGGKGVNVTSILMAMGYQTLATGFAGGPSGQTLLADLTDRGVPHLFTDVIGPSRRIVSVHDSTGAVTKFNEPGPRLPLASWEQLRTALEPLVAGPATALVFSGKLPTGSRPGSSAKILDLAREHGVPTVIDAAGPALDEALRSEPTVVKPNRWELQDFFPECGLMEGARRLRERGAKNVIITLGDQGLLLLPATGPALHAYLTERQSGDSTGAGDALAAAVATGIGQEPWSVLVRRAVAWSGASVRQPLTGLVDPQDVQALEGLVVVDEISADIEPDIEPTRDRADDRLSRRQ
ncbi:1-phosphofructokinase family hexose kinase [Austwickia chelonae]|uniref:1-phosphofructokinase family hexose kinase n=1 Tax=Austwickia chelonae TaxID=100225 RepID=UPI000E23D76D|nr:hexose kinase [Austwickia chelonae]